MRRLMARNGVVGCCLALALALLEPTLVQGGAVSGASPTPTPTQSIPVIRAGYIPVIGSAAAFVIDGLGWDKENGFDLQLQKFDSGPNMAHAFAFGALDAYIAGIAPVIIAKSQGLDLTVVAALAIDELVVTAGPQLAALPGKPAAAIAALSKKLGRPVRFGVQPSGSVPQTMLLYWLQERAKVDMAHVALVPMGIEATQHALAAYEVDAAIIREPALTIVRERDPQIRPLAYGGEIMANQPGNVAGLSGSFIAKYPDVARRFVGLLERATHLLQNDPKAAAAAADIALGRGLIPLPLLEKAVRSKAAHFVSDPQIIAPQVMILQDFQIKQGLLKEPVPLQELFDFSIYRERTGG
jgi:NitT/TauT family transport system substrate-binding protein